MRICDHGLCGIDLGPGLGVKMYSISKELCMSYFCTAPYYSQVISRQFLSFKGRPCYRIRAKICNSVAILKKNMVYLPGYLNLGGICR